MSGAAVPPESRLVRIRGSDITFNLRAAGVAHDGSRVLLHRAEHDYFWSLPGGRVELGESAAEALHREMREEMAVDVRVGRLLWLVESYFVYLGRNFHEVCLYFEMTLPSGDAERLGDAPFYGSEDLVAEGRRLVLTFQWFRLDELERLALLPPFFREALRSLPEEIRHITIREDEPY